MLKATGYLDEGEKFAIGEFETMAEAELAMDDAVRGADPNGRSVPSVIYDCQDNCSRTVMLLVGEKILTVEIEKVDK